MKTLTLKDYLDSLSDSERSVAIEAVRIAQEEFRQVLIKQSSTIAEANV